MGSGNDAQCQIEVLDCPCLCEDLAAQLVLLHIYLYVVGKHAFADPAYDVRFPDLSGSVDDQQPIGAGCEMFLDKSCNFPIKSGAKKLRFPFLSAAGCSKTDMCSLPCICQGR